MTADTAGTARPLDPAALDPAPLDAADPLAPLRDRFAISVEGGDDMEAKGNIVDHEYKIERGGEEVAVVSRRWFRVRDTYGIEIKPGEDDGLLLATAVCIDQMGRD